jgi:hypothetical protein
MLNPSTADASVDDPTIRRCTGFSEAWGFDSLTVVNLFAFRSPHPEDLAKVDDPVGPVNDLAIREAVFGASRVVVAWGAVGASYCDRIGKVINDEIMSFGS